MDTLKVKQALTGLILNQPFFGALALRLTVQEDTQGLTQGTAATDGKTLWLDSAFVDSLSSDQLKGLIAHEVMHCAQGHVWRQGARDGERWNGACDYANNGILQDAGFYLPEGALLDPAYKGMASEAIYNQMSQQKPQPQNQSQPSPGQGQKPGMWGQVIPSNSPDAQEMEAEWQVATLQAAQLANGMGKLPGGLERLLDEIKNPVIDWKAVLKKFVQETAKADYSWKMPSSRYLASGLFLPSLKSDQMKPLVIGIDTSGSVSEAQLASFAAEIQSIMDECQPESVKVFYCDHDIQGEAEFYPFDQIQLEFKGGGGTSFCPVFDKVAALGIEPACLVYFTDLYGEFPQEAPGYPVLWLNTGDREGQAPFGETIYFAE